MSAEAEIVGLALELERVERLEADASAVKVGADGRTYYRLKLEPGDPAAPIGVLQVDGLVRLPPALLERLGLQAGGFVMVAAGDAPPAATAPAPPPAPPPVGDHWWTDEGTCGRCHVRASLVAGRPCAWRPDGAPEAGLRSDPAVPLNYDERRELTGVLRSLEDAWVGHDSAQAVPKALARALGAVAELHTRLMAIVEALPLDDARHRLEQLRCLRVPQEIEIELDATRPCPEDARARFLSLWESIPATYHPHPSDSSRRRFVPMHHLELPRPVCKGAFADGRRFLALRLVEEYRPAQTDQAAEEKVAGVAHERDCGPDSPWVWTGTSHGALIGAQRSLADPALVEALLAGRVVRQPEGFSLVVPSGPRRCLQCGERPPQPTGAKPVAQGPEGDPPV